MVSFQIFFWFLDTLIIWMDFRKESSRSVYGKYSFLMLRSEGKKGILQDGNQVVSNADKVFAVQVEYCTLLS